MSVLSVDLVVPREAFDVVARLEVPSGRALALVGPNGAGKSTVLAAIAGLVDATGTLRLDGRDLGGMPAELRGIGVVFQDFLLFPHLTVRDNVAFPERVRGASRDVARASAQSWLERFDLGALAERHPQALSGGQAQRVAVARALASQPAVLVLDEPMAALDVEVRDEVRDDLARYIRDFGGPTIVVSHDTADAAALADEVAVLERGRIVQRGTLAELAAAPATPWIARFSR
ncbi:ABC transporter ATP-binding protein [Pseudolysinimonas sp.]|jgi:molybdate transport system ATP-binding protein|uniref:ABC transporter ATP-binding protein n=1 Tax=Pseudolysinimonas sp. TaxID=2680009 RepID=UPI003784DE86